MQLRMIGLGGMGANMACVANIVPDNLEDMYQGCIDGVCNCDPWK